MELNLNVPDEMVSRLRPHENRLLQILELGLDALETAPDNEGSLRVQVEVSDPEEPTWTRTAQNYALSDRSLAPPEEPCPEDLRALEEGTLDPEARDNLLERLAVDREAVDELLDLQDFEALEPPSKEHILSDHDVKRAFAGLQQRLGSEATSAEAQPSSHSPTASPTAHASEGTLRYPSRWNQWPMALAASLVLTFGSIWLFSNPSRSLKAQHARVLVLENTRGVQPHSLPSDSGTILVILPKANLSDGRVGVLRLHNGAGTLIYESEISGSDEAFSDAFFTLPGDKLAAGSYRLSIVDPALDETVNELEFRIEQPARP